jgi:hypothetical protein
MHRIWMNLGRTSTDALDCLLKYPLYSCGATAEDPDPELIAEGTERQTGPAGRDRARLLGPLPHLM